MCKRLYVCIDVDDEMVAAVMVVTVMMPLTEYILRSKAAQPRISINVANIWKGLFKFAHIETSTMAPSSCHVDTFRWGYFGTILFLLNTYIYIYLNTSSVSVCMEFWLCFTLCARVCVRLCVKTTRTRKTAKKMKHSIEENMRYKWAFVFAFVYTIRNGMKKKTRTHT